jgi:hypothetical protein
MYLLYFLLLFWNVLQHVKERGESGLGKVATPEILALRRWKQEDCKFEASLSYFINNNNSNKYIYIFSLSVVSQRNNLGRLIC